MSKTLRDILRDPKKNQEFEKGILKLNAQKNGTDSSAIVLVGNNQYKIQFVDAEYKNKNK